MSCGLGQDQYRSPRSGGRDRWVDQDGTGVYHRAIPPTLHFSTPNPHVAFDALPLRVQVALEPLPENSRPAIAGVSSFGFGGTNAHVVLEEAPLKPGLSANRTDPRRTEEIVFPLSAKSPAALWALAVRSAIPYPAAHAMRISTTWPTRPVRAAATTTTAWRSLQPAMTRSSRPWTHSAAASRT